VNRARLAEIRWWWFQHLHLLHQLADRKKAGRSLLVLPVLKKTAALTSQQFFLRLHCGSAAKSPGSSRGLKDGTAFVKRFIQMLEKITIFALTRVAVYFAECCPPRLRQVVVMI